MEEHGCWGGVGGKQRVRKCVGCILQAGVGLHVAWHSILGCIMLRGRDAILPPYFIILRWAMRWGGGGAHGL